MEKRAGRNLLMGGYLLSLYIFEILFVVCAYIQNEILLYVSLVFAIISLPLLALNIVYALIKIGKPFEDSLTFGFVTKLCAIPFFLLNFFLCFILLAGFLNPWLLIGVPLVLALEIGMTYLVLIATSINSVIYLIRKMISKEIPLDVGAFNVVLHLFFVLDVFSSLYLFIKYRNGVAGLEESNKELK